MRTVTFSNAKVAELVNSKFVPVWYNRGQGFHNCEKTTEQWIFNSSTECYPTKNICTFFMTPDLEVVYYVSGYYAPDVFLDVLAAVQKLQASPKDRGRVHKEISAELSKRLDGLKGASANPKAAVASGSGPLKPYGTCSYEKIDHQHNVQCLYILSEAFRYRKEVHDSLTESGSVPLERVQHSYKFGNSFTEEAPPAAQGTLSKPQAPAKPGTVTSTKK
jgi:uncharacterized protein YyaL (SSP411 family)